MKIEGGQKIVLFDGSTELNYGTLGVVMDRAGTPVGLTCAHVAYGFPPDKTSAGHLQLFRRKPGPTDLVVGPPAKNGFASVTSPLDAALVTIVNPPDADPMSVEGIGKIRFATDAQMKALRTDDVVKKVGAKTGHTQSKLADFNQLRTIEYAGPAGTVTKTLDNLMTVKDAKFAAQGDSGSLVVKPIGSKNIAIGMIVAVDSDANEVLIVRMPDVLDSLA